MIVLLTFSTLISFSCGNYEIPNNSVIVLDEPKTPTDPRKMVGIDEEFKPYVKLFEKITGRSVGSLPINFGDDEEWPDRIGVCNTYAFKKSNTIYKEVYIKREFWDDASKNKKESLILHELGHCVLNRDHTEETIDFKGSNIPASIMNPINIGGYYYYSPNRKYYHKELGVK